MFQSEIVEGTIIYVNDMMVEKDHCFVANYV